MALYDDSMGGYNPNALQQLTSNPFITGQAMQSPSQYGSLGMSRYGIKPNASSPIFMGWKETERKDVSPGAGPYAPGSSRPGMYFGSRQADELSYGEAALLPATSWDEKTMKNFINKGILYKMPGFSPDMGLPEVLSAWDDLLSTSFAVSGGEKKMSPWDIMETYAHKQGALGTVRKGDWIIDIATNEKIKYVGPKTKTTTQKRVDLSSPEEARALTTQMLTELLGRAPTTKEMAQYRSAINSYEQKNPEVATTTVTLNDMGEEVASNTTTTGGASSAALQSIVSDQAKQNPEYGKYQAGTTYYNALLQLLGG